MHGKILAILLIVVTLGAFKLTMYEIRRYYLSEPAMPAAGPAIGGGSSRGAAAP